MSTRHRDTLQKQTQQDWANREYIEIITSSIKKIVDFLNSFGKLIKTYVTNVWFNAYCCTTDMSCRGKLAGLNEKLTGLERQIEYLEARVCYCSSFEMQLFFTYFTFCLLGN